MVALHGVRAGQHYRITGHHQAGSGGKGQPNRSPAGAGSDDLDGLVALGGISAEAKDSSKNPGKSKKV